MAAERHEYKHAITMTDSQIRVLSLNCWGLKFVSKNRVARLQAIATELGRLSYDIVALQEIWVSADYELVRASVSSRLPYAKYFYSGVIGAGLAIFSRFPIISASIHPYSLSGIPMDSVGDWFAGKSAASVVVSHPILGSIQVFNTHFAATGNEDGPEHFRAHRLVNAWECAKLIKEAAHLGRYVIATGDLNSVPTALPITILREYASLTDSWTVVHPPRSGSPRSPNEAISLFGVTADSPLNTFTTGKSLDTEARRNWGKRLDYIMYRQPERDTTPPAVLTCIQCQVAFTEKAPGREFSFSDHFGVEATLKIQDSTESPTSRSGNLSDASISTIDQALAACYRFSRHRSRRELMVFVGCVVLLLGVTVGSSWLPHSWINPLFILFTVFIAWLGTTMLYQGFIYGHWECNALMNVIEELEIYRKGLGDRSTN